MDIKRFREFRYLVAPLTATTLAAVAMTGCGADKSESIPVPQSTDQTPRVEASYFPNGTRILKYTGDDDYFADILQSCDGSDLLEQTAFLKYGYGAAGNGIERSVNHPACADDGKLTEQDFALANKP